MSNLPPTVSSGPSSSSCTRVFPNSSLGEYFVKNQAAKAEVDWTTKARLTTAERVALVVGPVLTFVDALLNFVIDVLNLGADAVFSGGKVLLKTAHILKRYPADPKVSNIFKGLRSHFEATSRSVKATALGLYGYYDIPKSGAEHLHRYVEALSLYKTSAASAAVAVPIATQVSLESFLKSVQILAPNLGSALTVSAMGIEYCIWWNSSLKAANIQKKENFRGEASLNELNKVGISKKPNAEGLSYFVDNQPSPLGLSPDRVGQLEAVLTEVDDLKKVYDEKKALENKFSPRCLSLLLSFLKGPEGEQFRYTQEEGESRAILKLGGETSLVAWLRVETEMVASAMGSSVGMRGGGGGMVPVIRYYINIQNQHDYGGAVDRRQRNKLGICLNSEGGIESIYKDGTQALQGFTRDLYKETEPWNKNLTQAINGFLEGYGLKSQTQSISLHSLAIKQCPEVVLSKLCSSGEFRVPSVNFMKDTLEKGPVIDAGGPRNQLMAELGMALFNGAEARTMCLSKESSLPMLSEASAPAAAAASDRITVVQAERIVLNNVGKLFAACFQEAHLIIGRVLPDKFFGLLKEVLKYPALPTPEQIVSSAEKIGLEEHRWMWDFCKNNRALTEEETQTLEYLYLFESLEGLTPEAIKNGIQDYLIIAYRSSVLAAWHISQGIPQGQVAAIRAKSDADLSTDIQGMSFDRENIANRVVCDDPSSVVQEKAAWIKEFIMDTATDPMKDQKWVEDLLQTITGQRAVTGQTQIKIERSGDAFCHAHTCFKSIDVPEDYNDAGSPATGPVLSNKQKFLNNLLLTMSQTEFDTG